LLAAAVELVEAVDIRDGRGENERELMQKRTVRYQDAEGSFELALPADWQTENDGEGGLLLYAGEGNGLLHLMPFGREPEDEVDAADELYAFLAEHEIELQEDEVEDIDLAGGEGALALCEYEEEEDGEEVYWLVGVAAGIGQIIFASYSCPSGQEEKESEVVREILSSLVFVLERPAD
jgi:hypothetical protein